MFFKDAPLAFAGAVVLVAVAVWFASSSWHLQIIRDKESIIATKDATISAQADENKRLKEKVAEYQKSEPKKEHIVGDISPAGQERIVEKLKVAYQPNYIIHIRPLAADPKSIRLTATLAKVFEASGYNLVRGTPAGDLIKEPFPGLKVVSANNLSDSLSHALDQIFAELGQGMNVYERDTTWNTNIVVLYLGFPN